MVLEETYAVTAAENGRIALDFALAQHFDAVVLDLMMPVMDGETFMTELRGRGLQIPVILASAANQLDQKAKTLGANDFLKKPFDVDALETKLARLVR